MPRRKKIVVDANGQAWTAGPDPTPLDLSTSQIAAALGRKGGRSKSAVKSTAARANGAKGGRPRKTIKPPT